jgi:hypothetical protein
MARRLTLLLLVLAAAVVAVAVAVARAQRAVTAHWDLAAATAAVGGTGGDARTELPPGYTLSEDGAAVCGPPGEGDDAPACYPRVFQPTDTFAPVRPGQRLPQGLHVRVDMTTGAKHARLLQDDEDDNDDDNNNKAKAGHGAALQVVIPEGGTPATVPVWRQRRDARRQQEQEQPEDTRDAEAAVPVAPLTAERKAELDALWEQLMAMARQETELLQAALRTLRDPLATEADLTHALDRMADTVRHIDYGRDLLPLDGLAPVVQLCTTHPSADIRAHAAGVLGTALQRYGRASRFLCVARARALRVC